MGGIAGIDGKWRTTKSLPAPGPVLTVHGADSVRHRRSPASAMDRRVLEWQVTSFAEREPSRCLPKEERWRPRSLSEAMSPPARTGVKTVGTNSGFSRCSRCRPARTVTARIRGKRRAGATARTTRTRTSSSCSSHGSASVGWLRSRRPSTSLRGYGRSFIGDRSSGSLGRRLTSGWPRRLGSPSPRLASASVRQAPARRGYPPSCVPLPLRPQRDLPPLISISLLSVEFPRSTLLMPPLK